MVDQRVAPKLTWASPQNRYRANSIVRHVGVERDSRVPKGLASIDGEIGNAVVVNRRGIWGPQNNDRRTGRGVHFEEDRLAIGYE